MPNPISTAPTDGRKVMVQWRDRDGVENTGWAQYLSGSGDPQGAGWWTYVDSDTMKRVQPHGWSDQAEEEGDE
ncbi:MAG: hypothetical protein IT533_04185 [Hyphomicrobiales bacterium]|jgi:hypothetical protein|nr:hypothetical protein [Hyphomicrobiales bacterium]